MHIFNPYKSTVFATLLISWQLPSFKKNVYCPALLCSCSLLSHICKPLRTVSRTDAHNQLKLNNCSHWRDPEKYFGVFVISFYCCWYCKIHVFVSTATGPHEQHNTGLDDPTKRTTNYSQVLECSTDFINALQKRLICMSYSTSVARNLIKKQWWPFPSSLCVWSCLRLKTVPASKCPKGWVSYKSNCYFFSNTTRVTYAQARTNCRQTTGADLVSIMDNLEQDFVRVSLRGTELTKRILYR